MKIFKTIFLLFVITTIIFSIKASDILHQTSGQKAPTIQDIITKSIDVDLEIDDTQTKIFDQIKSKLKKYHLDPETNPITYKYKTEIITKNINNSINLDPEIKGFAKAQHLRLNQSLFFDPEFIINSKKVRRYHLKPKYFKQNVAEIFTVQTEDGKNIDVTYFNRNSDKLLVVGEGFTNDREVMSPFIDMFIDHDIILFDYRGHGYKEMYLLNPDTWDFNITKMFFGANTQEAKMGAEEEKDVFAVVDTMKKHKNYKQVTGLGICYSALIFAKASAIREIEEKPPLFDKLILDGCWISLENFIEKLQIDLKRICSPQKGGCEKNWLMKKIWFKKLLTNLGQKLFSTKFNRVSILDYLPKLTQTPILYFYGKDDLVVNRHEFEVIWNATKTKNKTAIITSNPHVRNHLKQKELYLLICDLFLNLPHEKFISCLENKEDLINHYVSKLI